MSSTVYFAGRRAESREESLPRKVRSLFERAGAASAIPPGGLVAVKVHFGEPGNTSYIHPTLVRQVVDKIKEAGGKPFLCDTNTLYAGRRSNSVDHLVAALENGFAYATVGAPLIICDGLRGRSYRSVPVPGKHFHSVHIAPDLLEADALVVLTHVKGHMLTGFGGALKNTGMGGGSRSGKQKMHSTLKPALQGEKCRSCGECARWCPEGAIHISSNTRGRAVIDLAKCSGCAECIVSCSHGAVQIQWQSPAREVGERIAEYAAGVLQGKNGRAFFINFLLDIVPDCDCCSWSDAPVLPDIGILASADPVAADQASADLINTVLPLPGSILAGKSGSGSKAGTGWDRFAALHPESDWKGMVAHAEALGLGSRRYALVKL